MKGISPQRERFAQEVAKHGNQSEAYRVAFPKSKQWLSDTVHEHASRLMAEGKVKERVFALRKKAETRLGMSREKWLAEWVALTRGGEPGDRMRALENLGKALGYYAPAKLDVVHSVEPRVIGFEDRIAMLDQVLLREIDRARADQVKQISDEPYPTHSEDVQ